jgi:cell division inhibitor SepF
MGLGTVWERALVYFGIAEEEDWDEEGYYVEDEEAHDPYERPNVRRLPARRRRDYEDDWTDPEPAADAQRTSVLRPRLSERGSAARVRQLEPVRGPGTSRVHLVMPRGFNDAQQLADRFKDGVPVILNLQSADSELSKRLIDFASGLTYALDGGMQRVADKVFLLTPRDVELSAEDRARMLERGFFNQA